MSSPIDTDLLSVLERKRVPPRLTAWLRQNDGRTFLSVVSFAEFRFGVDHVPASHRPGWLAWLAETRRAFDAATEPLSEPVLVGWKRLLTDLKRTGRTMTCEDSPVAATALFHGHTVATRNTRHLEASGVPLVNPLL